jgi:hypothetical protein
MKRCPIPDCPRPEVIDVREEHARLLSTVDLPLPNRVALARTHIGETPFRCNVCHESFSTPGYFIRHCRATGHDVARSQQHEDAPRHQPVTAGDQVQYQDPRLDTGRMHASQLHSHPVRAAVAAAVSNSSDDADSPPPSPPARTHATAQLLAAAPTTTSVLSSQQQAALERLVSVMACSPEQARHMLEANSWDLDLLIAIDRSLQR